MLTVPDPELAYRYQSRWLSIGHPADAGGGLETFSGVIAGVPGDAANA
jgi:hypothetical protein